MSVWLEARRQEREIRKMHIDHNRRAERRKNFFESIRKDPAQFMQLHGRSYHIHTERSIARAAEENTMHAWAVDPSILIDRFDARAHLDFVPETTKTKPKLDSTEEKEEIVCDFERYRIPIMNDCRKIEEAQYLKKIHQREYWTEYETKAKNIQKMEREKKKKIADTKTNIHYSYGDSDVVPGRADDGIEEDEDEIDQEMEAMEDLDAELDIDRMDPEAHRRANKWGEAYGIKRSLFINMLRADQIATRNSAELRRIERQKLALSGRDGKSERLALKRRRNEILGGRHIKDDEATTTLLSFVRAKDEAEEKSKQLLAQADDSNSSEDEDAIPIFISSFGNEQSEAKNGEEEEETKDDIHGPEFPSEQARKIMDMNRRAKSPVQQEAVEKTERRRSRSPYGHRRRSRSRSRSRSNDRYRRDRRSRSRSRRRSRSRSRSRSRGLWNRQKKDDDRKNSKSKARRSGSPPSKQQKASPASSDSSSGSGSEALLEIRSSMSDSEKERIEIENRKRRIRKTKRMVKKQGVTRKKSDSGSDEDKKAEARKLRILMQKKMRKTEEQMRGEEEERKREEERRKRLREEEILMEEEARRARARERRLQEREEEDRRRAASKKDDRKRDRSRDRHHRRSRSRDRR